MWFGESEKIIKRIFTEYQSYAKECEQVPILLFNEADAILSKRKDNVFSPVAQTENTIQNIILEAMENFEGILIATTNLPNNLDPAFDRRFLFKVPFEKPSTAVRAKIWAAKLPHLGQGDCRQLAEYFDFSGGQIDNIARKCEIQEVVQDILPNFETILAFCREESLFLKESKIGFI
ncbi:MAG: ATP-binding protein [Cyclobacteriaceae bacterium]